MACATEPDVPDGRHQRDVLERDDSMAGADLGGDGLSDSVDGGHGGEWEIFCTRSCGRGFPTVHLGYDVM